MRSVTCNESDRKLIEGGLALQIKQAQNLVASAYHLPETCAAAERDRDRLAKLLEAVRADEGAVIELPRRVAEAA